jgi:hypothetical protein
MVLSYLLTDMSVQMSESACFVNQLCRQEIIEWE